MVFLEVRDRETTGGRERHRLENIAKDRKEREICLEERHLGSQPTASKHSSSTLDHFENMSREKRSQEDDERRERKRETSDGQEEDEERPS